MDILAELFSSEPLVKIMRLFLLNPQDVFEPADISKRANISSKKVRYELRLLKKIGFITNGTRESEIVLRSKKRGRRIRRKKIKGWQLNVLFSFMRPLKHLLLNAAPISRDQLLRKVRKTGNIKLVVLTGFFLDSEEENGESRVDLLIVGDNIKKAKLERVMRSVEAKVGRELNFATLNSKEFSYRVGMYDKFIRDIFDYPHEKIYDKLGL